MQQGLGLQELAAEIVSQARAKTDLLADNSDIRSSHYRDGDEDKLVHVIEVGDQHALKPNSVFNAQMAVELKIPKPYYDRMAEEEPELLDRNINQWLASPQYKDKRRLVRALDTTARAYLSKSYRPLDNVDLAQAVLPAIKDLDLQVKSSQITERRMYIQAVTPRFEGEIGLHDPVQAGIVISNSEVGAGSLRIEYLLWRLACLNGMITGDVLRRTHVGRGKLSDVDIGVQEYYRDSTRKLDDAAFFSKVRDAVEHTVTREAFDAQLAAVRDSTGVKIAKPKEAVEVIVRKLELNGGEQEDLLANLIEGGDLSIWGMANAVTALAHKSEDYDRSVELERAGMKVVKLPQNQWEGVLQLAA